MCCQYMTAEPVINGLPACKQAAHKIGGFLYKRPSPTGGDGCRLVAIHNCHVQFHAKGGRVVTPKPDAGCQCRTGLRGL